MTEPILAAKLLRNEPAPDDHKIIGARQERQVVFSLASLEKLPRLGRPEQKPPNSVTPWRD